MAKLIETGQLEKLDTFLASADSPIKPDDVYKGLSQWCKGPDGSIYGLPVDCNPKVFWFNKDMLQEAGVIPEPGAAVRGRAAGTRPH